MADCPAIERTAVPSIHLGKQTFRFLLSLCGCDVLFVHDPASYRRAARQGRLQRIALRSQQASGRGDLQDMAGGFARSLDGAGARIAKRG